MAVKVYFDEEARLIGDMPAFASKYHPVSAGGGLVMNDSGELLLIFRRGKWDLPKGKAEEGEPPAVCAEREVKEETGLVSLHLQKLLGVTYHTYTENGRSILKETHWYLFGAPGSQPLHPQAEEDISLIEWANPEDLDKYISNTYPLILDVLDAAGVKKKG